MVKVRSTAEPPSGFAKLIGSSCGAAGLFAVQAPRLLSAALVQVQPAGWPLIGQPSDLPKLTAMVTGLAFFAGTLMVSSHWLPAAAWSSTVAARAAGP